MKGGQKWPSTSIRVIHTALAETSLRWPCSARRLHVTATREYPNIRIGIHTEELEFGLLQESRLLWRRRPTRPSPCSSWTDAHQRSWFRATFGARRHLSAEWALLTFLVLTQVWTDVQGLLLNFPTEIYSENLPFSARSPSVFYAGSTYLI